MNSFFRGLNDFAFEMFGPLCYGYEEIAEERQREREEEEEREMRRSNRRIKRIVIEYDD